MRDDLARLRIARVPVAAEATEQHVRSFIESFVVEPSRVRLANAIRRHGWRMACHRGLLVQRLDRRRCVLDEAHSRPTEFPPPFRRAGIYIDDAAIGLEMTLEQASELSRIRGVAGLYSIDPGRLAVLFHWEWGVWYCEA